MQVTALKENSQEQVVDRCQYKCWVLRIKLPTLPTWVIPTLEILGLILYASLAYALIE